MGSYCKDDPCQYPYLQGHAYLSPESPSRIYFNESLQSIKQLAFEDSDKVSNQYEQPDFIPQPGFIPPNSLLKVDRFYYSFAILDDVTEVTPCVFEVENFVQAVAGFLFRYRDGRRACVGQIRLDMLQPALEVTTASQEIYLQFKRSDKGTVNATRVSVDASELDHESDPSASFVYLQLSGKLEWCFSHNQSLVSYHGNTSPMPSWYDCLARKYLILR